MGPIHLDLLDLSEVHLDVTAVSGADNLLGNLLCAVAGLLDNPGNPLGGISALLTRLLTGLGCPACEVPRASTWPRTGDISHPRRDLEC